MIWFRVAILATILGLGLWIQTLRVKVANQQLIIQTDQADAKLFRETATAQSKLAKETYDAALARQTRDLADARATSSRLRSTIAQYTRQPEGLPEAPLLRDRLATLGALYGAMAEAGERASHEADAVNDALAACEVASGHEAK